METSGAPGIAERFERQGFLEFRVVATRVVPKLALAILVAVLPVGVAAWLRNPIVWMLAVVWLGWLSMAAALIYAEQLLGAGPALRVDRTGVTIRRWNTPLHLAWSDVCRISGFERGGRTRSQVTLSMSPWTWHDYRTSRRPVLRALDRITHYSGLVVLLDILDVPAGEIIRLLDPAMLDRLTIAAPPYRFVLDIAEGGGSALWYRGGRQAKLESLPLSAATCRRIEAWNGRLLALLDRSSIDESMREEALRVEAAGRALAHEIEAELGPGATVVMSTDLAL